MIEPRILKGFRDSLPKTEMARQNLISGITKVFRSFGFVPIDTPALEYTEVLLGKGGGETDKQVFRFNDNGGRDVSMRFDLTVPLARYVSLNREELVFPFKRYHIAKVWRGEKPQKGRYREFLQCDFDTIGADSAQADFEILHIIHSCLRTIGVPSFRIRISHRQLVSSFLASVDSTVPADEVLRVIDKLGKAGVQGVQSMLLDLGLDAGRVQSIMDFISIPSTSYMQTLEILEARFGAGFAPLARLREIAGLASACSILDELVIDTSITRGLDYYTGIVWETYLSDLPGIGSVCSGGRYDNLTGLYSERSLPGVGSCIGLDRLIAALEELGSPVVSDYRTADVLVLSENNAQWSETTAQKLRDLGLDVDCYLGTKGRGAQFAYAQSNGIRYVVCTEDNGRYSVKDIATREMIEGMTLGELAAGIR